MIKTIELKIYNSLSHKKELFTIYGKNIGIYVCGVTPYDITHLGHAFVYVFFDVVIRYLEHLGNKVNYIQNVTDVDDDLLKKAKEQKFEYRELAENNFAKFKSDLEWLNIRLPEVFPRATANIPEIIKLNLILEKKGFAYSKNGSLYFDISAFPSYGKLSGLKKEEMLPLSVERGNFPEDPNKKNPLDFVLWQKTKPGEPVWESPWGPGRPGWHIECSAMSMKYLGETLDIHGGGGDLIYPHHESEIAQSESATGKEFVRFFMHTSMLYYQGRKMSKSLGNMIFVSSLKNKYSKNIIRLLLLNNHYRHKWEFKENLLTDAQIINTSLNKVWSVKSSSGSELDFSNLKKKFYGNINDDFNTPATLQVLLSLSELVQNSAGKNLSKAKMFMDTAFKILGLSVEDINQI